ncbi:MAG: hypothetical protein IKA88_04735 [Clostridia bacterium]|nr:hypothetical protein [Clostridia bacterium]
MSEEKIKNKKTIAKKALKIIGNIFLYLIIAMALFVLIISIMSKKDRDGTATIFGHQLRFVQSDSMEKCDLTDVSDFEIKSIRVKSCIFVDVVPESEEKKAEWYKDLEVGDVLTFKYVYSKQETITHRIVNIEEKQSGGYIITLEGDNKNAETDLLQQTIDTSLEDSPNYIIGKVTGQSYVLGVLVYAFKTPVGIVCFIIIPCLIIIAFEVIRLIRVFGKDKKEKLQAEKKKQDDEIEALKRQLAELQNQNHQTDSVESSELLPEEAELDRKPDSTIETSIEETESEKENQETI